MLALDGQTLAALGATCVDHGTATLGLHANQETVGTGAADLGRLVSTFHVGSSRRFSICVGKAPCLRPTIQVLRRTLSLPSRVFFHMQSMFFGLAVNLAKQSTLNAQKLQPMPSYCHTENAHEFGARVISP